MTYVIGKSFNAYAKFPTSGATQSDRHNLLQGVGLAAFELVGLALAALALSSVTSSLWIWTGEHNVMALRKRVYRSVTEKDMIWFDTQMGSEGNVQSADGEQGPIGAGGLMAKFTRWALFVLFSNHSNADVSLEKPTTCAPLPLSPPGCSCSI
jgi:ATP-binding cassette subfamily B (MDR/TAP) protein 1